jgi:TolB protein
LTDAPGFDGFPAWSPDGNRIAFVSDRGGGARRLWLMGAEGTDPILLADHAPYSVSKCSWSPDGTSIAYQVSASAHSSERAEIWVHEIGALPRRMLGGDGFSYADPAWSPDGLRIAYATDRDGATEIWILATGW